MFEKVCRCRVLVVWSVASLWPKADVKISIFRIPPCEATLNNSNKARHFGPFESITKSLNSKDKYDEVAAKARILRLHLWWCVEKTIHNLANSVG